MPCRISTARIKSLVLRPRPPSVLVFDTVLPVRVYQVLHTHQHDFDAAGPLYDHALKLSGENPLVQRACGLFLLASCQFPMEQTRRKALALLEAADYR